MKSGIHFYAAWLLAISAFFAAAVTFSLSLNHPISADLAMLHYSAWLINEKGFILYRDIFEINFPAPFLFHSILGCLIGYEAPPMRWVDLALLAILGITSWKILAPISRPAALYAPSLFALLYLVNGGEFILEREFLCLIPAAAAFLCATSTNKRRIPITVFTAILAAVACSMKPNAVVMIPALLWMLLSQQQNKTKITAVFLISAATTATLPFLWLIKNGGMDSFIKIYQSFLPIYTNSRYDLWHYDSTMERINNLLKNYTIYAGIAVLLSAPGLIWAYIGKTSHAPARHRIMQLAMMAVSFTFYETIAGKFWVNHLFPSAYWSLLCFSLLLTPCTQEDAKWKKLTAIFLFIYAASTGWLLANTSLVQMQAAHQKELTDPGGWRARQITRYLDRQQLQPGDTVQMLDMAGDGQAAMLMAKATSATRHLIDVPLYMEPDSLATKVLREQFISDLGVRKPRFIVYVDQFLHPGGGNRLREFKALSALLDNDYEIGEQQEGRYTIYRRKSGSR